MRIAVLVPALNEAPWGSDFRARLSKGFAELRQRFGAETFLVYVDDGSDQSRFPKALVERSLMQLSGCRVFFLRHEINRGQGAALMTALTAARGPEIDADYFVTFDSDGQHSPDDLSKLIGTLVSTKANIVFGNRFSGQCLPIPKTRACVLRAASVFERVLTGLSLQDAHNGYRAFDRRAASVLRLKQDRMAHATEIKQVVARHKLRYVECPVNIRYSLESLAKGQSSLNALNILQELVQGWMFQ